MTLLDPLNHPPESLRAHVHTVDQIRSPTIGNNDNGNGQVSNSMHDQNEMAPLAQSNNTPPCTESAEVDNNFALEAPSTGARSATPRILEFSAAPYCSDPLGLQNTCINATSSPHRLQASDQVPAFANRLHSLHAGTTHAQDREASQSNAQAAYTQSPHINPIPRGL